MTLARIILVERIGIVVGLLAMTGAVAAVEWRAGLFFAGFALWAISSDFRLGRRR